jgi:hypothetical protein
LLRELAAAGSAYPSSCICAPFARKSPRCRIDQIEQAVIRPGQLSQLQNAAVLASLTQSFATQQEVLERIGS